MKTKDFFNIGQEQYESEDTRAAREVYVDATYVGQKETLVGKKGECYSDRSTPSMWFFRALGDTEWYRVHFDSLRFIPKRVKKKSKLSGVLTKNYTNHQSQMIQG